MTTPGPSSPHTNIVTMALDDHMLYAFCVLTHSMKNSARLPFDILVGFFPGKLAEQNQRTINEFLDFLDIPHEVKELQPNDLFTERRHLTMTTFSKFVLSDHLAAAHLWLDIDTIARPGWDGLLKEIETAASDASLVVAEMLPGPQTRFAGFNAGVLGWTSAPRADWEPELANMPQKRFSSEQFLFNTLYGNSSKKVDSSYNFLSSWFKNKKKLASSKIIHFSGPIKPWHLPRRHRKAWLDINGSWEYWFSAEDQLLHDLPPDPLRGELVRASKRALFSGRLHTGKGALAGWVMRALSLLGPLGHPFVALIVRRVKS